MPNDLRRWGLRILHHLRFPTLGMLNTLVVALSSVFKTRAALQLENLALRHQLGVLHRSVKKPKLTPLDRLLWAWSRRSPSPIRTARSLKLLEPIPVRNGNKCESN